MLNLGFCLRFFGKSGPSMINVLKFSVTLQYENFIRIVCAVYSF